MNQNKFTFHVQKSKFMQKSTFCQGAMKNFFLPLVSIPPRWVVKDAINHRFNALNFASGINLPVMLSILSTTLPPTVANIPIK